MAGLTTALVAQFKADLGLALHNMTSGGGHAFKMSLFKANASIASTWDKTTTTYSTTDELTTGSGYTAGGAACTNAGTGTDTTSSNNIGYMGFSGTVSWSSATFTTRGCSVYNSTSSNKTVFIYDFGADQALSSGTFTVSFPTFNSTSAIIRLT